MSDERWRVISRLYDEAAALAPVDGVRFCARPAVATRRCGQRSNRCCSTIAVRTRYCNRRARTEPLSGNGSAATRFARCSASAGWVRCIAPTTAIWVATSRSSFCRKSSPPIRSAAPASYREARLLATLDHSRIRCDLRTGGMEEADVVTALVLELVEGPTLEELLQRGPIKVADALVIARQVAEALDAPHGKASSIAT